MSILQSTFWLTLGLLVGQCQSFPDIEGFDQGKWKVDPNGCQGFRIQLDSILWENREKLLGLSDSQIMNGLGKPNEIELYVRNQKFFVYYVTASEECEEGSQSPYSLVIRFDALNKSNEISLRN